MAGGQRFLRGKEREASSPFQGVDFEGHASQPRQSLFRLPHVRTHGDRLGANGRD